MGFRRKVMAVADRRYSPSSVAALCERRGFRGKLMPLLSKPVLFAAILVAGCATGLAPAAETNGALALVLSDLAKSSRPLPFRDVIQATTGHRILPLDTNDPAHAELCQKLRHAAALAGERLRQHGLSAARANEAGNQLEPFVRAALREAGLATRVPANAAGRAQVAGYPDLEITGPLPCYLELKTYSAATANTTQRSFYYSPSASPKVTRDALHLLLAYELEKSDQGGQTVFAPVHWKLISLHDLEVDLKFEFNQSNRGLYNQPQALLGEGGFPAQ
jgi:hypothetical protein